jgi:hypothetical protein
LADENRVLREKIIEAKHLMLARENAELKRKYEEFQTQEKTPDPFRRKLFPLAGNGPSMQRSNSWQSRGNYMPASAYGTPPSGR